MANIKREAGLFIVCVILCELAGVIGAVFTFGAIPSWYAYLNKPSFAPPNWVFAPAWNILYVLMAVALFLVWRKGLGEPGMRSALTAFFGQLALNALWSVIFFGLHNPMFAFAEILALWVMILLSTLRFYRINRIAGILMAPYLLWVFFAALLNFSVWMLN